jgi:serine/threonine-protein kinase
MAPEKIGRYEIKSELGRGGMATVYRGWDPLFEREVAVKVLPPELLHADPQFKMRFEREAKIIASLEHPSIVPVYDVGDDTGQPYFVMRYMSGGSLSDRIKAKNLTVDDAIKILGQLAPGLDEAHAKGIVHRDLKPSNILFDGKGTPYISDFGIAKLSQAQSSGMTGSAIIGTPAYMAPEQAQGTGVDGRTDIYAVGIILFEMLTGKQPYEADTPMAVAFKHITDPVPNVHEANPSLPESVDTVIQKAMAKSKDDRFATAEAMVDTLRDVSAGRKISVEMPTIKGALPKGGTQMPAAKTVPGAVKADEMTAARSFNIWLVIVPVILVAVLGGGGYFLFSAMNSPKATEVPTLTQAPIIPTDTAEATESPATAPAIVDTATATEVPATDTPPPPTIPVVGGADKIAFIANKEIYMMNVDGGELIQITTDGGIKSDLQWLPDGKNLVFISGLTVKYYNVDTDSISILMEFPSASSLNAFRVSHDGKRVMITLSNEIFVVPFGFEELKDVEKKSQLLALKYCIDPRGGTEAAARIREVRWSSDDTQVAWLYRLATDIISVYDIGHCDPTKLQDLYSFPSSLWSPPNFSKGTILDFDWNGDDLFVFNTIKRFDTWGDLHIFNRNGKPIPLLNPIDNKCCYRDTRWSPDGKFLLFAYQEEIPGQTAPTRLYYVRYSDVISRSTLQPIPGLDGLFKDPREAPQPALRPAQ